MNGYYVTLTFSSGHYRSTIVAEDARPLATLVGTRKWDIEDDFVKTLGKIFPRPEIANEVLAIVKRAGSFELHDRAEAIKLSDEIARELGWL